NGSVHEGVCAGCGGPAPGTVCDARIRGRGHAETVSPADPARNWLTGSPRQGVPLLGSNRQRKNAVCRAINPQDQPAQRKQPVCLIYCCCPLVFIPGLL